MQNEGLKHLSPCCASVAGTPEEQEAAVQEATEAIEKLIGYKPKPRVLMVLGSGLGSLAQSVEDAMSISFQDIPHMVPATAPSHAGRCVFGNLAGIPVMCLEGRLHPYEGYSPREVTYPIRVARALGAEILITTNAAGGINASYETGQVVLIDDHINLTGQSPLIGPNIDAWGPRHPDMTTTYTPRLQECAMQAAQELTYTLQKGVYIGLTGPSFETPAEIRAFRTMGADLVGMSTVWEAIAAAHAGMEVLGFSMVSNMAAGMTGDPLSSEEVGLVSRQAAHIMCQLITKTLELLPEANPGLSKAEPCAKQQTCATKPVYYSGYTSMLYKNLGRK